MLLLEIVAPVRVKNSLPPTRVPMSSPRRLASVLSMSMSLPVLGSGRPLRSSPNGAADVDDLLVEVNVLDVKPGR